MKRSKMWARLKGIFRRQQQSPAEATISPALALPRRDGQVRVAVRPQGVFLKVEPPEGGGSPATVLQAYSALEAKGIVDVEGAAVREAVALRNGQWVKVAERRPELDEDGRVEVEVAPDGLSARVRLFPPRGGRPLTKKLLEEALREAGVVTGIKWDKLEKALTQPQKGEAILAAEGIPPQDGHDTQLIYHFRTHIEGKPVALLDGRVDFHNLDLLENVSAGAVLATILPPTAGSPGLSVRGEKLPAREGQERKFTPGKNVRVSADGRQWLAEINGQVLFQGGEISVCPLHVINGDVDLATGNINFLGSVLVWGNVNAGFSIKADGNIEIYGSVEGADLEATGDIIMRSGARGQNRAKIKAQGNIIARFIENAEVTAEGDVIVSEAILHSRVEAGRSIQVRGGRGMIAGGELWAGEAIEAQVIGTRAGTRTVLRVGATSHLYEEYREVRATVKMLEAKLEKLHQLLALVQAKSHAGNQTGQQKELLRKLQTTLTHEEARLSEFRAKEAHLSRLLEKNIGVVKAGGRFLPGVEVTIGEATYHVREEISHARLRVEGKEIRIYPY